jgi:hypothetical protein
MAEDWNDIAAVRRQAYAPIRPNLMKEMRDRTEPLREQYLQSQQPTGTSSASGWTTIYKHRLWAPQWIQRIVTICDVQRDVASAVPSVRAIIGASTGTEIAVDWAAATDQEVELDITPADADINKWTDVEWQANSNGVVVVTILMKEFRLDQ